MRRALSEGLGSAQIQTIASEECINEVDYVDLGQPVVEVESTLNDTPSTEENPKRKRRGKNASD